MNIVFDVYEQDPTSNGLPDYITTIEHHANNHRHLLDYLAGFTNENLTYIIRNLRVYS